MKFHFSNSRVPAQGASNGGGLRGGDPQIKEDHFAQSVLPHSDRVLHKHHIDFLHEKSQNNNYNNLENMIENKKPLIGNNYQPESIKRSISYSNFKKSNDNNIQHTDSSPNILGYGYGLVSSYSNSDSSTASTNSSNIAGRVSVPSKHGTRNTRLATRRLAEPVRYNPSNNLTRNQRGSRYPAFEPAQLKGVETYSKFSCSKF